MGESAAALPDDIRRVDTGKLLVGAFQYPVLFLQLVALLAEFQPALVDKAYVVRDVLQVAGYVGGDQDRVGFVLNEFKQHVENFAAYHGIKSAGGLVQDQQPWGMGHRRGKTEPHLHTPGEAAEFLPVRESEPIEISAEHLAVPAREYSAEHPVKLLRGHFPGERELVEYHADILLQRRGQLRGILAEYGDAAVFRADKPEYCLYEGGFTGSVLADKSQYRAAGDFKVYPLERERRVPACEIAYFNAVFHSRTSILYDITAI